MLFPVSSSDFPWVLQYPLSLNPNCPTPCEWCVCPVMGWHPVVGTFYYGPRTPMTLCSTGRKCMPMITKYTSFFVSECSFYDRTYLSSDEFVSGCLYASHTMSSANGTPSMEIFGFQSEFKTNILVTTKWQQIGLLKCFSINYLKCLSSFSRI